MARLYVCPCCRGQGLVHDHRGDEDVILECVECSATGRVTQSQRAELLAWQGRCRLRPVSNPRAPSGRRGHGSN
jgi:DnaJ-class molecular chaperone